MAAHHLASTNTTPVSDPNVPVADRLSLLRNTAESALERAVKLGELSGLLTQLRQTANSIHDPWFIIDLNGTCIYMNSAAESFCGIRMEDIGITTSDPFIVSHLQQGSILSVSDAGESFLGAAFGGLVSLFTHLLPRTRNAEELRLFLQDFTQGPVYRQELRCTLALEPILARSAQDPLSTEQGEEKYSDLLLESAPSDYHYQLTRYPLHNKEGQLIANTLHVRDITEQVRDEKNKSALLSSVSHDLRTPLTTIKAAITGLLESDIAWEEQDRQLMLEEIDAEVDHLTALVNALVEMSRINMGALLLEKEWCDIVEIFYGSLAKAQRILAGRSVQSYFQPDLPLMYVDHAQLERVFYNLLENAARYSLSLEGQETAEPATIRVIIDTVDEALPSPESGGATWLRVRVIDSGPGVPSQERERIFKSFYALRSYGSGLGLAICKGIIDAHQGRIWVEAADEQEGGMPSEGHPVRTTSSGSCFVFTLPTHPYPGGSPPVYKESHEALEDAHVPYVPALEELR
jgi:signal transduction histidine kinase